MRSLFLTFDFLIGDATKRLIGKGFSGFQPACRHLYLHFIAFTYIGTLQFRGCQQIQNGQIASRKCPINAFPPSRAFQKRIYRLKMAD